MANKIQAEEQLIGMQEKVLEIAKHLYDISSLSAYSTGLNISNGNELNVTICNDKGHHISVSIDFAVEGSYEQGEAIIARTRAECRWDSDTGGTPIHSMTITEQLSDISRNLSFMTAQKYEHGSKTITNVENDGLAIRKMDVEVIVDGEVILETTLSPKLDMLEAYNTKGQSVVEAFSREFLKALHHEDEVR